MATYLDLGAQQTNLPDVGAQQSAGPPSSIPVSGTTGGEVDVVGGALGAIGNPMAGVTGGIVYVMGGADGGVIGAYLTGTTGGSVEVHGGANGSLGLLITGRIGGIVSIVGGITPGVIMPEDGRLIRVFINGTERTDIVKAGVERVMQIGGGSRATCTFMLTQRGVPYIPVQGDEVLIFSHGERWFAGLVDNVNLYDYPGKAYLSETTVNCVDYGALLDRIIIGREYLAPVGNLASILFNQIATQFLYPKLGISYVFTWEPGLALGDQIYNWLTGTEVLNNITRACNGDWRVDFNKNLYLFPAGGGYAAAPFTISDNDGNWIDMRVSHDSSKYRNKVGARNSANTKSLWTDSFVGTGSQRIFPTQSPLHTKPIIRVNGVAQVVVDVSQILTTPYDFYWLAPNSVVHNLNQPAYTSSDTIDVSYLSVVDYVAWAQDDTEIALYGLYEGILEVHDVPSAAALQAFADAGLTRALARPITATIRTDRYGLEPGQGLVVNTTRPALNDTLLITRVTSSEVGKKFFRHTVQAVNSANQAVSNETAFYQSIIAQLAQPKDRVRQNIIFNLAVSTPPLTNPGLQLGLTPAIKAASDDGYLSMATLIFSSVATTPTTSDIVIDVYQNGVSIFGATKMVFPAGSTTLAVQLELYADPLPVFDGDIFTCEVLSTDTAAMDGVLAIEMFVK